jgi:DNA-3-methyladenine glycosylase
LKQSSDNRINKEFFENDALEVAPNLLGKFLVVYRGKTQKKYKIVEVEVYRGEEDKGCHANKGKTKRNEIMYSSGGYLYVYIIYGIYWMLNIVTGKKGYPQAILIRGLEGLNGPGKITKTLGIDKSYYGENLAVSNRIWIEDNNENVEYFTAKRIGIDYAGEPWKNKPWRYILKFKKQE